MRSEFQNLPITMFVESLRHIIPPQTIIHIGAGTGQGMMHSWRNWDVPRALIIEADEARLAWTNDLLAIHPEWKVVATVIAEQDFEIDYYFASNPNEDGLISPGQLSSLWLNLSEKSLTRVNAQSLDSLLEVTECSLSNATVTWIIIDCLSALDILKGAKQALEASSVLWLRVLLQPISLHHDVATIKDITFFLQSFGYRCVNVVESNHPAIGEALFVRDWHTVLQQNATVISEVEFNQVQCETIITKLQNENASVVADKFALEQLLLEQNNQRIALHQEKSVMEAQVLSLQNELSILGNERDEQLQLVANGRAQIEMLSQTNHQLMQEKSVIEIQIQSFQNEIATVSNDWNEQKQRFESEITSLKNEIERLNHNCLVFDSDKTALENLLAQQSEQHRLLQNEILSLAQARDEQTYLVNERQHQIESLSQNHTQLQQEKSAIETQVQSLQNEMSELAQARDEQTQFANAQQVQIESLSQSNIQLQQEKSAIETQVQSLQNEMSGLTQARDEQTQLANARQVQIESLSQSNAQLQQEKLALETQVQSLQNEVSGLTKARDGQNQTIVQNKILIDELRNTLLQNESRVTQLETHLTESDARQKMLNEEIIKAEAQIELIKDVLLRESEV